MDDIKNVTIIEPSAERFVVPYDMEEEDILKQLEAQFAALMSFEKDLLQVMNNE